MSNISKICSTRLILVFAWLTKLILTHQELDAGFDFGILNTLSDLIKKTGYFHYQATKPDTLANAFTDSPVGLLAYLLEKYSFGSFKNAAIGPIDGLLEKFDRGELNKF